jgi:hypothetical protein
MWRPFYIYVDFCGEEGELAPLCEWNDGDKDAVATAKRRGGVIRTTTTPVVGVQAARCLCRLVEGKL